MAEDDQRPLPDPAVLVAAEQALENSDLGLRLAVCHCPAASITPEPTLFNHIVEQGTLNPDLRGTTIPLFEFAEHTFLGDALHLPAHDAVVKSGNNSAANNPFTLPNGLVVTYGQINGLGGDFFAATDPICLGDADGAVRRFQDAFNTLSESAASKKKAEKLIDKLKVEVKLVDDALREQKINPKYDVSEAYKKLKEQAYELDQITKDAKASGLTYLEISKKNFDHFGGNARKAYNAGHTWALTVAKAGTPESLRKAYTINAFADHFLEDSFASGHLRVPREQLVDSFFKQAMALLMHDEDNRLGIRVSDSGVVDKEDKPKTWTAYGDRRLLDYEDNFNKSRLFDALRASVDEVHCINQNTDRDIKESDFKAWNFAPTLDSEKAVEGNFAPLLMLKNGVLNVRSNISKTVDQSDRDELSTPEEWNSYRPIDGWIHAHTWIGWVWVPVPETAHWAWLAYSLAPNGTIKKEVLAWLKAHVPHWLLKKIGISE